MVLNTTCETIFNDDGTDTIKLYIYEDGYEFYEKSVKIFLKRDINLEKINTIEYYEKYISNFLDKRQIDLNINKLSTSKEYICFELSGRISDKHWEMVLKIFEVPC